MKRTTVEIASASPGRPPLRCRVLAQPADAVQLQQLTSEGCTTHLAAANSGDIFDDVDVGGGINSPLWCTGSSTRSTTGIPLPPSLADEDGIGLNLRSASDHVFDLESVGVEANAVVVCYWNGGCRQAHEIAKWLRSFGVSVKQHHGKQQIGASCAIVAARVAVMLRSCASLCSADLSDAVSEVHIVEANSCFGFFSERRLKREPAATRFLRSSDCYALITYWSGVDPLRCARRGKDRHWVKFVSYDQLVCALRAWLIDPPAKNGRMMFVCNTETAGEAGQHFFVVALSW